MTIVGLQATNANAQAVVQLKLDRYSNGKFGKNFGNRKINDKLVARFTSNGMHLLLHARAFDIDTFSEVRIKVNGRRLGRLPQTRNRGLGKPNLWIIPASIQKTGVNTITFRKTDGDNTWGVQDLGLFAVGGKLASFGNWRKKRGMRIKNRAVINLPDELDDSQISLSFFDIDNAREAIVKVSGGADTVPTNTPNNGWGRPMAIELAAGTDSLEIQNLAATSSGKTWGFRVEGFYYGFPSDAVSGFETLSQAQWDTAAVRRVLHTFAYGGRATERQITAWSQMPPRYAINEMLNFDEHNLKLSPTSGLDKDSVEKQPGTLGALTKYWPRRQRSNPVPDSTRKLLKPEYSLGLGWGQMAASRGLNPFRQKIGLWETNYHMAVNMNTDVNAAQVVTYYDKIMEQLENNTPYRSVMSDAAASAAIATQYNHGTSRWDRETGTCECNEDFAREYHQLFFGILGRENKRYHETVSIKNMSKVLTGINVDWSNKLNRLPSWPTLERKNHHVAALEIQNASITGDNARQKIAALSTISIESRESEDNLPVMIIGGLADDNLTAEKTAAIRNAWRSMRPKNLLGFLRAYAISTTFHSADRIKYWSSIDRSLIFANKYYTSNREAYFDPYNVNSYYRDQVTVFRPTHNVFGNQTGREAARSPDIVRRTINRSTENLYYFIRPHLTSGKQKLPKNWVSVVPKSKGGVYRVKDVAEWLWNQHIGDGLKNFDSVARAHVYALLGHEHDLLLALSERDINRVITEQELRNNSRLQSFVKQLANSRLALGSRNKKKREAAHLRFGRAMAFIVATPFSFAQQGR